DTAYTLVEKVSGSTFDTMVFTTKPEGWINYTGTTISWGVPVGFEGEASDIMYRVFVNGKEVIKLSPTNLYPKEELLGKSQHGEVKVVVLVGNEEIGSYESVFKTASTPF